MDFTTVAKIVADFGTAGLFGIIFLYIFWKYIPSLQDDFKEAMREAWKANERQRHEFLEAMAEERKLREASTLAVDRLTNAFASALLRNGNGHEIRQGN